MAELKEFKCPACGGALEFNSSSQKMKCPYCDTVFEVEALNAYSEEAKGDKEDDMSWEAREENRWQEGEAEGMRVYICNSCGGEIIADENTAASSCPFCGNPVVMQGQFAGELRPDCVIPFKKDRKAAKEAYLKHIKGKPLLPKVFREQSHIDEIKGVYVPFWLYDANAHANVRYRASRVRFWSDADYDYTETRFYAVTREGNLDFEKVPVDGSSKIDNVLTESIEPFDHKEAVDFQPAYLAGYLADKYDADAGECEERANQRIKESTEAAFRETVRGYTTVTPDSSSITLHGEAAKYGLYPVWLLNTTWNGEKFLFAMNGQTGKMTGNLPVDRGAFGKWFLGITAGVLAVTFGCLTALDFFGKPDIPAERQLPRLVDEAGLLDRKYAGELETYLDEISETYQCDVAIVTQDTIDGENARDYADDFYDYNGYGYGEGDDGILLLMAMEEREWYITTYNYGKAVFTDRRLDDIADKMVPYMSDGDYDNAFAVFAEMSAETLADAETEGIEREREGESGTSDFGFNLVAGLIAGLVIAGISTGIMRSKMKSVRSARGAAGYVKPGSLEITADRDLYLYKTVTRTAKPKDNDSGGSSHTSSSGRTHGGTGGSF